MKTKRIDSLQLFCMIVLFQLGSSIVLGIGLEANKDAWIAILLATIIGVGLYFLYTSLYIKGGEGKTFTTLLQHTFSTKIGNILAGMYYVYFLYLAARITADFSFFINGVLLWSVPAWTLKLTILLLVAYVCYLDIETLGRSSEGLAIVMLLFLILIMTLTFFQTEWHLDNLRPVLENGFKPIWKATFPTLVTFPFGEFIVFICYFSYINHFNAYRKKGWIAIVVSGILLMLAAVLNVGILTDKLAKTFTFPFIKTIEHISFLDFIHHLELLAVFVFIIGGLIKISIFSFAGISGIAQLFKVKDEQKIILPFLLTVFLISAFFMRNFIIHLFIGLKVVPLYLHLFFQIGIPIMGFLLLMVKSMIKKHESFK